MHCMCILLWGTTSHNLTLVTISELLNNLDPTFSDIFMYKYIYIFRLEEDYSYSSENFGRYILPKAWSNYEVKKLAQRLWTVRYPKFTFITKYAWYDPSGWIVCDTQALTSPWVLCHRSRRYDEAWHYWPLGDITVSRIYWSLCHRLSGLPRLTINDKIIKEN